MKSTEGLPKLPPEAAETVGFFRRDWPSKSWRDLHVAVALSGGGDSMALLRLMLLEKEENGGIGSIQALHVNHKLRGADSLADAQWCQQQCESLGVELRVLESNTQERADEDGDGLEAAARAERYELLAQTAEQLGARYLAFAHTRDDQVETILFRLLRGTGLRGLRGIPKLRQLTKAVTVVRPLLACSREMLEKFLMALGQSARFDGSNKDFRFTRNRIRHELLPKLREEYNTHVDAALVRLAAQAEATENLVEQQARQLLENASVHFSQGPFPAGSGRCRLAMAFPASSVEEPLIVSTAIRLAWRDAKLPEKDMTYVGWRHLASLLEVENHQRVLNMPGDVRASIEQGSLVLEW